MIYALSKNRHCMQCCEKYDDNKINKNMEISFLRRDPFFQTQIRDWDEIHILLSGRYQMMLVENFIDYSS